MNLPPKETLEKAFFDRDASYDGLFLAGVTTTGIFCRPSCPARKPKPDHVVYFETPGEALFAGYRPCLRCHPLEKAGDPPWMENLLARIEGDPATRIKEGELRSLGLDPATVRRRFQARFGISFNAFQRARRLAAAFEAIKQGDSLDEAILDHGYESHSGFREAFGKLFGDAPGRLVAQEGADFVRLAWIESPLGPLVAGATDRGICLLEFSDRRMLEAQVSTLRRRLGLPIVPSPHPLLEALEAQLSDYFEGRLAAFDLPIDEPGTDFQVRVWATLRTIPRGQTWSYAQLAEAIGDPKATRAVARANGMNRVAILVPCHRVIGADGGLGGYGGGLWRKSRLLELEGVDLPALAAKVVQGDEGAYGLFL